jgi:hypothetical protein
MRECGYVPRRQIRFGIVPKAKNRIVSDSWGKEGNAGGVVEDEMKEVAKNSVSEVDEMDWGNGGT